MIASIPDDEAFRSDFKGASISKSPTVRYLLEKIERSMRVAAGADEVEVAGSHKVHVEHVYPQQPGEWRIDDHEAWVNRIGNQTLLHGTKNREISNKPFPEKQQAYEGSMLLVTRETQIESVWDAQENVWRPEGIVERQELLANLAVSVWPSGDYFEESN